MRVPASQPWSLPGYDVQELLGTGGTGEVWRAVELSTGEPVALKRLRPDADPGAADALRREAAVLRTLDSPHVVRLRDVVGTGVAAVLVLDLAAGGSLAALLVRRGALDPAEVVTVAAPLAQALAAVHGRGLLHGDLSPANVLFTAEGMPLLADLGVARLAGRFEGTAEYVDPAVAAGAAPSPASDVWALAAVCHCMLAGCPPHEGAAADDVLRSAAAGARAPLGLLAPAVPRPLIEAVEAALDPDPSRRPDAATFASRLRRAHGVAPVRLTEPSAATPGPTVRPTHAIARHAAPPRRSSPRRLPRRVLLAAVTVLLLGAAAGIGWALGLGAPPGRGAVLPLAADRQAADWPAVLDALDAARADALATADPQRLSAAYAPGSPALAADTATVRRLADAGQRAFGVRHTVRSVRQDQLFVDAARLHVVDTLAGYEVRTANGAVVRRTPPRGEQAFTVELARTPVGWRLVDVSPAP